MKARRTVGLLLGVWWLGVLTIGGCIKPKVELAKAEGAIQEARSLGAPEVAAAELTAAETCLAEGKKLERKGKYKSARQKYEEAYFQAQAAKDKAVAEKVEKRTSSASSDTAPHANVPPPER